MVEASRIRGKASFRIAIAAPTGDGRYTSDQIEHILKTAASGFHAAVITSSEHLGSAAPVVVHSGFWGRAL